jgi:GNAT superfamily N-acetyltransferase
MQHINLQSCNPTQLSLCKSLTYPSYHPVLVAGAEGHEQVVAVVAVEGEKEGVPVGLILAALDEEKSVATIQSLAVSKTHRQQGIATALLSALEEQLRRQKAKSIHAVYTTAMESHPILSKLQQKQGWPEPKPRNYFCRGSVQHVHDNAAWMKRIRCPSRFELFSWEDLSGSERESIEADVLQGVVPKDLSPFQEEETLEPMTSVGIRADGRVVGWQTNHSLPGEPGVLRYSYTYAYPEFQKTGRAFILIKEAIKRNMDHKLDEFPRFVSSVAYHREPMLRFYERHLTPVSEKSYSSYGVSKVLS